MPKKILVIGGNATGLKAAVRIKRLDPAAEVTIDGKGFKNIKFMDGGLVGWPFETKGGIWKFFCKKCSVYLWSCFGHHTFPVAGSYW